MDKRATAWDLAESGVPYSKIHQQTGLKYDGKDFIEHQQPYTPNREDWGAGLFGKTYASLANMLGIEGDPGTLTDPARANIDVGDAAKNSLNVANPFYWMDVGGETVNAWDRMQRGEQQPLDGISVGGVTSLLGGFGGRASAALTKPKPAPFVPEAPVSYRGVSDPKHAIPDDMMWATSSPNVTAMAGQGLPMDQASKMARAKEMGFDIDQVWYHGSEANIEAFDVEKQGANFPSARGRGFSFASHPDAADPYSKRSKFVASSEETRRRVVASLAADEANKKKWPWQKKVAPPEYTGPKDYDLYPDSGSAIYPVYIRRGKSGSVDAEFGTDKNNAIIDDSKNADFDSLLLRGNPDGAYIKDIKGGYADELTVFDPRNIRSVNAAFDPAKSDSANLLASNPEEAAVPGVTLTADNVPAYLNFLSNNANIFEPPSKPALAFENDYPGLLPDGTKLSHDIDGAPIRAEYIAGRREAGGPNKALTPEEINSVGERLFGSPPQMVARSALPRKSVGSFAVAPGKDGPRYSINIADDLPADKMGRVVAHEAGHGISTLAGGRDGIPTQGIARELEQVYHDLNDNTWRRGQQTRRGLQTSPESNGYSGSDIPAENIAEAIRAYMANPDYLKTVAPKTAARIREYVNENSRLNRVIQFNSNPLESSLPGLSFLNADDEDLIQMLRRRQQ